MDKFPEKIEIKADKPHTVSCRKLIRSIPGKRDVFEGVWGDREVIVKIFRSLLRAGNNMHREWKGLTSLRQKGLAAPEGLFYGKTDDGRRAIVTEKIAQSRVVFELLECEKDEQKIYDVLKKVFEYVADMHNRGIAQEDLHTGNFLFDGERIYALDPAEMSFYNEPLSRKRSLKQLAILLVSLPVHIRKNYQHLLEKYFEKRTLKISENDNKKLSKYIAGYTRKSHKKALKKSLRNSKRYVLFENKNTNAVFRRNFICHLSAGEFVKDIDKRMNNGEIMKNGNTCFVSRFETANKNIVVKRYNHKGIWHSIRHTLKGSRAKKSWLNAHTLLALDIKTPNPLGFIELRKGGLIWKSYLITEYIHGVRLHDLMQKPVIDRAHRKNIKTRMAKLLRKLAKSKIVHGDMKQSNILIQDGELVLTDLDAMKVFKSRLIFKLRAGKDLHCLGYFNEL